MKMELLEVTGLQVFYKENNIQQFIYPEIRLNKGECLGIIGPSGRGKTTLLNSLFHPDFPGYVTYQKGKLSGKNIADYSKRELYQKISYMPQFSQNALNPSLSVEKQIHLIQKSSVNAAKTEDIISWIKELGLAGDVLKLYPYQLSGGMKQRLTLLFGFIKKPELYIIDEPGSGLDAMTQYTMYKFLKRQKKNNLGIILVSHEIGFVDALSEIKMDLGGEKWEKKAL